MLFNISNISPEPLHAQISHKIRAKILNGSLMKDEMLPSIRGLASDLKVGVITVQRAYDDLIREGLIYARHGKGYFVSSMTDSMKKELAKNRFRNNIEPVIKDGLDTGLSKNEMLNVIKRLRKNEDK